MTDKGKEIDAVQQAMEELKETDATAPTVTAPSDLTPDIAGYDPTAEDIDKSAKLAQGTAEADEYLPELENPPKTDNGNPVDINLAEPSDPVAAVVPKNMPEVAAKADVALADEAAAIVASDNGRLPKAPETLVSKGLPNFGMFKGMVRHLNWEHLEGKPYSTKWHHKRWTYVGIAAGDNFFGIAVAHVGWSSTAFAYMFDRKKQRVTKSFSSNGLPLVTKCEVQDRAFGNATYSSFGQKIQFLRKDDTLQVKVDVKKLSLDAEIDLKNAPILCSVARANWVAHSTHKSSGLPIKGHVVLKKHHKTKDVEFDLPENSVASVDSSNGLLARHTQWLWASAHTKDLGFNLQYGYMGKNENAIWVDGEIYPVGNAIFAYDRENPLGEWKISTDDGKVDLTFTPEGLQVEDKELGMASTHYVQPIGVFRGTLKVLDGEPIEIEVVGVAEDHDSKW